MDAERRVERETFEKWGAVIYPFRRHDFDADIYAEPSTQAAWEAWQRAWSESRAALAAPGPAQAGDAVAWQIVDHNYGPTHYFGMTEDDAWARMVKASGEGRSVWARTRFARPLYAAPAPAQADPWAWAVLLPGNTPQQARIRMTEREAMSCAAELPGFVIVPLYAATSRPGGAS